MKEPKPLIGISTGDPAGIGPEVTARALALEEIHALCRPLVVGDRAVMEAAIAFSDLSLATRAATEPSQGLFEPGARDVLDLHNVDMSRLRYKTVAAMTGKACFEYIKTVIELALAGKIDATVTGPIHKEAIHMAGLDYAGHTEIYADLTGTRDYIAGSTFLSSLLPISAHEGGAERMLARLRDRSEREQIRGLISESRGLDWGWHNILVTSVNTGKNKPHEGLNLRDIAERRGEDPVEALFNIIMEEENAVTMVSFNMSEEDVRTIMESPFQMVCTDGIVLGKPHPRAYGSFPRILGRYVKDGVIRLEDAIRKMTSLSAQTLGIRDRGLLKQGMHADITIFDPDKIIDKGTYKDPIQFPEGIEYVIVNGTITVENGVHTGRRAGKVLKHS